MDTLLSVPPALVAQSHTFSEKFGDGVFVTHDPKDKKLGSGGGTAHLIVEAYRKDSGDLGFEEWSNTQKRVIVHSGGQSRRLPAYAPSGKATIPVPVFRWMSGQRIDQSLLDLQLPLLRRLLEKSSEHQKWLIASGDVLVWHNRSLPEIPEVDVLCVGIPESPETASGHGVFFVSREDPTKLQSMLQKPSPAEIAARSAQSLFLIDVGIWILSTRAMLTVLEKSGWNADNKSFENNLPDYYDLYSEFGLALGETPTKPDPAITRLSSGVLLLPKAEFYHFGRNSDIIRSSLALQNRVQDPQRILSPMVKPHPSIFIQNCRWETRLSKDNHELWIENSYIGDGWQLNEQHVLSGIPENNWCIRLPRGICIDMVPVGECGWTLRPYGFDDAFKGSMNSPDTQWMGTGVLEWCTQRKIDLKGLVDDTNVDIQFADLFPVVDSLMNAEQLILWMIGVELENSDEIRELYLSGKRLSADAISSDANLNRLFKQQQQLLTDSLPILARNSDRSVFSQVDLDHASKLFADTAHPLPGNHPDSGLRIFPYIRDLMFRSNVERLRGLDGRGFEQKAFSALRETVIVPYRGQLISPGNQVLSDQVVWSRSPIRLDLAGGWTDTPPYCFLNGGRVINLAVELNGQPPIQVFLRVSPEKQVVVRSIDLGVSETIHSYDQIAEFSKVGSGFSIPKAALALAGFHPDFNGLQKFPDLKSQLDDFGGGIEITLLCAIPKGSGLGTSSILAATVLGALSELCGLAWDKTEIAQRTLVIEQMLTTGGGWQDQYGGILHGIKHLETRAGLNQIPTVHWLPDHLFTDPEYTPNLLLYYTGITRVAKDLLGEIVRGMFLNKKETLSTLNALQHHTAELQGLIQSGDFPAVGRSIRRTWKLNQQLDSGTNPPVIAKLIESIDDLIYGGKLLGAGGGGYLLMLAKDSEAALRIRKTFEENPLNATARFVNMNLSSTGLRTTRS
ncbi:MAG: bifunctional fucokinase/fucose-1-phosphate guanylyltransferase [Verrucomicrobia bacterium]|nr:bifunctional fucokinase/fucose-1-phosphate guanylyltransferase [Verrucomicrobiota bacterium]MDA1067065.1 bifunctional fucokinase/fucose-1-phosphate guanylyltransferase [Verrucomicrobiota bacterium]